MKKVKIIMIVMLTGSLSLNIPAQGVSTGLDLVSTYVWRGTKLSGPSIQPFLQYNKNGFTIGSWGSAGFDGFLEMDLFTKYAFDFGLTAGLTDYYFPGTNYFDYSKASGSHGYEVNLAYAAHGFSIGANYMLNEAGGAKTAGGDKYFELGYTRKNISLFAGAGDGWHTPSGEFGVVNLGLSATKELLISETFRVPVKLSAILNPTTKQYYLTAGVTL